MCLYQITKPSNPWRTDRKDKTNALLQLKISTPFSLSTVHKTDRPKNQRYRKTYDQPTGFNGHLQNFPSNSIRTHILQVSMEYSLRYTISWAIIQINKFKRISSYSVFSDQNEIKLEISTWKVTGKSPNT